MFGLAFGPGMLVGTVSSIIAFELSHSLSLLVIAVGIVSGVATIAGIIYGVRWKTAYEVEHAVRETIDDRVRSLAHERDELTVKLDQATSAIHDARQTIARLEALPNLERVLELMTVTFERITARIDEMHDENQQTAERNTNRIISEVRRTAV